MPVTADYCVVCFRQLPNTVAALRLCFTPRTLSTRQRLPLKTQKCECLHPLFFYVLVAKALLYRFTSLESKIVIQDDLHEGGLLLCGQSAQLTSARLPATRARNH
jgi:hypothetical protein